MPKKKPIAPLLQSRKVARKVTTAFHALQRDVDALEKKGSAIGSEADSELSAALAGKKGQLADLYAAYQRSSKISTEHFSTSRWVVRQLIKLGVKSSKSPYFHPSVEDDQRPRLLEVGAINRQLLTVPWLNTRAIDIRSSDEGIEKRDFLDLCLQSEEADRYHITVCSMVLNCVPSAKDRGRMLKGLSRVTRASGLVFIMIPRRCIYQSHNMCLCRWQKCLEAASLRTLHMEETPKIAFFVCQRAVSQSAVAIDTEGSQRSSCPVCSSRNSKKRGPVDFGIDEWNT